MNKKDSYNILIVGVGGQGTILAGRILARVAQNAAYDVKVSEIHGMSQRGGSVVTQVRIGHHIAAPIIRPGTVDAIVSFERLEALRILPWLNQEGIVIVNEQELYPIPVITGTVQYPDNITEKINEVAQEAVFMDALTLAEEAGNSKSVNIVLLGVLSRYLPMAEESWLEAISEIVKPKTLEINLKAFKMGREKQL